MMIEENRFAILPFIFWSLNSSQMCRVTHTVTALYYSGLLTEAARNHHPSAKIICPLPVWSMFLKQYLPPLLLIAVQTCKAQSCDEFTDLNLGHAFIGTSIRTRLLLYTRENVNCGTLLSHTNLAVHPQFKMYRQTIFIIHGFQPMGSPPVWRGDITERLLARKDCNLIIVDWNYGATTVNYLKAVENAHKVAANLTAFIKVMQEHGASLSSIHLIGESLGAHMSGFVGANLNGSIGRITALEPAKPQFTGTAPEDRLDSSDAQFVDVVHTDIDSLGFREPLGHIDFYANGGTDQPGCPKTIFSGGSYFKCDHQRAMYLFLESVKQTCTSRVFPCSSYSAFLDGKCMNCDQFGPAGCPVFGYDVIKWKDILVKLGQTKTYFTTNPESPFCMSCYRVDMMVWNKDVYWGYITVKLHHNGTEAVATIDHKSIEFQQYKETTLLAQFDKDIQSVDKVSLTFTSGNIGLSKHKLRVLRIQLTHLERKERSLCRYDVVLEEKTEVTFRPITCEESNF